MPDNPMSGGGLRLPTEVRALVFDVHGTLLLGGGPLRIDAAADALLRDQLRRMALPVPESPTRSLDLLIRHDHRLSNKPFPEVDLRALWAEALGLTELSLDDFITLETLRQPLHPMPGLRAMIDRLRTRGLPLGLLSNAQADTRPALVREIGGDPFHRDLVVLSHEHLEAKPSPRLFDHIVRALAGLGIPAQSAVMVGNDPLHDLLPARQAGLRTVLVRAHPSAWREGPAHLADAVIGHLDQLPDLIG